MTEELVQLDRIVKHYGRGHTAVTALDHVTLTVPRGAFWAIMGPSGSGKSTLLHLVGLLDRPSDGTLHIDGTAVTQKTKITQLSTLRRELIGFIFQQFFLLPRLTAIENVMLPGLYLGRAARTARERARQLVAEVGLDERQNHRPNQLSGGEQQRVAIARALMNNPPLILADEPTGNLDSKNGALIMGLIEQLNRDGRTVLMVTHDEQIGKHAQKIIRLKDGKLT
ncbi:ABC transporter ATP-binding protein [Candidatus Berkelbacteria bacterium]|nr:ABC transporter ATP-binding protein [Candidatus Berkelbacteria bacterium]